VKFRHPNPQTPGRRNESRENEYEWKKKNEMGEKFTDVRKPGNGEPEALEPKEQGEAIMLTENL